MSAVQFMGPSKKPAILNIYVSVIVVLLLGKAIYRTMQFMSAHPNDPGKAIFASIVGEAIASLIWIVPLLVLLSTKSQIAKWIMVVITFPLGLILLTSQVETYLNHEKEESQKAEEEFIRTLEGENRSA